MNMLDMYTREIVNQIYIAKLHRSAHDRRLLRDANSTRVPLPAQGKRRLVLVVSLLLMLVSIFVITAVISFS